MQIIINEDKEIFKLITYPSVKPNTYYISNYGRVYSTITNRLLKESIDSKGYCRVTLMQVDGIKSTNFKIHRLVAWEFCEGYDSRHNEVNHKDSNRSNNYYGNLEWVTSSENSRHAFNDGLRHAIKGDKHYANKYPKTLIKHIKTLLNIGYTTRDIMNYFGYEYSKDNLQLAGLISDIKKGHVWKDVEGSTTIEEYYIYIQ